MRDHRVKALLSPPRGALQCWGPVHGDGIRQAFMKTKSVTLGGLTFLGPASFAYKTHRTLTTDLVRFSEDEKRIDFTVMTGALLAMTAIASETKVSFYPPEGKPITWADRETIAGLFLGTLEADLIMESGAPAIQTLDAGNGETQHGLRFRKQSWALPGGGIQSVVILLDPKGDQDVIIASRAANESAALQKSCLEAIVQSLQPLP